MALERALAALSYDGYHNIFMDFLPRKRRDTVGSGCPYLTWLRGARLLHCVTAFAETKQELTLPSSSSPFSSSSEHSSQALHTNSSPTCCFPQFCDGHFLVSRRHLIKYPYNNCILTSECNCFLYFILAFDSAPDNF